MTKKKKISKPVDKKDIKLEPKQILLEDLINNLSKEAKKAMIGILSDKDPMVAIGSILSLVGLAQEMKLGKEILVININFGELIAAKKIFEEFHSYEEDDIDD